MEGIDGQAWILFHESGHRLSIPRQRLTIVHGLGGDWIFPSPQGGDASEHFARTGEAQDHLVAFGRKLSQLYLPLGEDIEMRRRLTFKEEKGAAFDLAMPGYSNDHRQVVRAEVLKEADLLKKLNVPERSIRNRHDQIIAYKEADA